MANSAYGGGVRLLDTDLYVALGVTFGVASIALFLRLLARRITKVYLWWDDHCAIGAWLFAIAWCIVMLIWGLQYSLGRPLGVTMADTGLDEEYINMQARYMMYMAEIMYAFSLAFSKFAILAFYWRMFKSSAIRLPIQLMFGCSMIWLIIRTFMAIFHCVPVQAFWDKTIHGATCNIDDSKFFVGTVFVHLFIDIIILALPIMQVRQLQLAAAQKIAVSALFTFGIIVCVASLVVIVESFRFDAASTEMPYDVTSIMIWATVEVNLAIVSACLPMLRPIFRRILPGSMLASGSGPTGANTGKNTVPNGITLTTITARGTRGRKSLEGDESSSTHQLADDSNDSGEFGRSQSPHESRAVAIAYMQSNHSDLEENMRGGIHVKSEMKVAYEPA